MRRVNAEDGGWQFNIFSALALLIIRTAKTAHTAKMNGRWVYLSAPLTNINGPGPPTFGSTPRQQFGIRTGGRAGRRAGSPMGRID